MGTEQSKGISNLTVTILREEFEGTEDMFHWDLFRQAVLFFI